MWFALFILENTLRQALSKHIQNAKFDYQSMSVNAPEGTLPDEVLLSDFWSLVADRLYEGDEVRVMAYDRSWVMRVIVRFKKGSFVHVAKESFAPLEVVKAKTKEGVSTETSERYFTKFRGPHKWKWCVMDSKGETVEKQCVEWGYQTEEEAQEKLNELLGVEA